MQLAREMFNLSRQRDYIVKPCKHHTSGSAWGQSTTYIYSNRGSFNTDERENCRRFSWLVSLKVPLDVLSIVSVLDRSETISMSAGKRSPPFKLLSFWYIAKPLFNFCGVMSSICYPWYARSQLRSFGRVSFWKQSSVVKCFWPSRNENLIAKSCL